MSSNFVLGSVPILSDNRSYFFQYFNFEYMAPKMLRKVLFEVLP